MHEFSLAKSVVNIANDAVSKARASRATAITLEIGTCAGVERSSFDFVWPLAVRGTVLEHAKRETLEVEGKARCRNCNHAFSIHRLYDQCPMCGSFRCDITQGKEFRVKSLRVI